MKLLVGTGESHFHELEFDPASSTISIQTSTPSPQPAWLHLHQDDFFTVSESDDGGVSRFSRTAQGWHKTWFTKSSSGGSAHCSIAEHEGKYFVLVANYVGHTVDVLSMSGELLQQIDFNGSGPFEGRQETSHCHQIIQDLWHQFVYVNDLGGDALHRYKLNRESVLTQVGVINFKPAQGPRHCAFNSNQPDLIYEICELSNEITIYRWKKDREPELLQTVSVLPDASMTGQQYKDYPQPASAGEIHVTKDGKFLYASTRYLPKYKSDTLLYAPITEQGLLGELKHLDTGLIAPWHFSLSPDEKWVAAAFKDSSVVKLYQRDSENGELRETAMLESGVESPSCVIFL